MVSLRGGRGSARQKPGDNHQSTGADVLRVGRVGRCDCRILGPGTDNYRHIGLGKLTDTLLALGVGKKRPVSHRAAIDHRVHTGGDQLTRLADQGRIVRAAVLKSGSHDGGHSASKDACIHYFFKASARA